MHRVGMRPLSREVALHSIFTAPAELAAVRAEAQRLYAHCLDRLKNAPDNRSFKTLWQLTGELLRDTTDSYACVPLNYVLWFNLNEPNLTPDGPARALRDLAGEIARLWDIKEAGGLPLRLYPVSPSVLRAIRRREEFYGDGNRVFTIHHLNALLICLGMALYDLRLDVQDETRGILRRVAPFTADMLLPDTAFRAAAAGFRALYLGGDHPRLTSVMLVGAGLSATVAPMAAHLIQSSYDSWKRGIRSRVAYDRHDIIARVLAAVWSSAAPDVAASLDRAAVFSNEYLW